MQLASSRGALTSVRVGLQQASGKTVNRWTTTGIMTASAMSNEAALLTQKWVRMLGIVPMCNQANT